MSQSGVSKSSSSSSGAFTSIVVQTFTTSGTYTPTVGMKYCTVEVVGGGGGGGGAATTSATQTSAGAGGGGGMYARQTFSAATIGASKTVTIAAAGIFGSTAGGNGGNGGNGACGSLVVNGGTGGNGMAAQGDFLFSIGGSCGIGSTGDVRVPGQCGSVGQAFYYVTATKGVAIGGAGGFSAWGAGGGNVIQNATGGSPGIAGLLYGGGGSGGACGISTSPGQPGNNGAPGFCLITEYIGT